MVRKAAAASGDPAVVKHQESCRALDIVAKSRFETGFVGTTGVTRRRISSIRATQGV
jgi:hypothetical protein